MTTSEAAGTPVPPAAPAEPSPARPRRAGPVSGEPGRGPGTPPLVLGVGLSTGATAGELLALVEEVLAAAEADGPRPAGRSRQTLRTALTARTARSTEAARSTGAADVRSAGRWPTVAALATIDSRALSPALLTVAAQLGLTPRTYAAGELAAVPVPNPARAPDAAVATPSVAEAAALLAAGPGAELLVPKSRSSPRGRPARATAAVTRGVDRPG